MCNLTLIISIALSNCRSNDFNKVLYFWLSPTFFYARKKIKSSSLKMSPLHTATWPTQRHATDELTSKSANDMSLIPRPSAVLLSSWVIWEPIFMTFLSPLHECACFRSCETFSPLQAMVESSAMKQQDKKTTNFCNKFKETTQNNINCQYLFLLLFVRQRDWVVRTGDLQSNDPVLMSGFVHQLDLFCNVSSLIQHFGYTCKTLGEFIQN